MAKFVPGEIVIKLDDEAMELLRRIANALAPEQADYSFGTRSLIEDNWSNRGHEGRGWQGE